MILNQKFFLISLYIFIRWANFMATTAYTTFRFGFDFNLNASEHSFETFIKIGKGNPPPKSSIEDLTAKQSLSTVDSAIVKDIWSQQASLNVAAKERLQATRLAVSQLSNEILVVAGHSDFIAAKVKLMTLYLRKVSAHPATANNTADAGADGDGGHDFAAANRFLILKDFVQLVEDLRAPPTTGEGGERSLDYVVMKLGMEKYKLIELQTQILAEVLQAVEAWQTYVKKQLVDVAAI